VDPSVLALLKRWSLGTYHGLRRQHIDACLNEFVFRHNHTYAVAWQSGDPMLNFHQ
jgi:hypothetical protein